MAMFGEIKTETGSVARSYFLPLARPSPLPRQIFQTHLTDVAVGIVELNAELQLVADFNAFGVRVLQAPCQGLRHVEIARELVSFSRLIDNLDVIFIDLILVGQDRPGNLIGVPNGVGIFRVEGQIVAFDEL